MTDIPVGYKQTEVGIIPNDWEVKKLKEFATLINGRAYKQEELLDRGKYKVLRVGNFFTNDKWYYSDLELDEKLYCGIGDLLYAWSCTYGAYIWNEKDTIFHYHIWKVVSKISDRVFLKYLLNDDVQRQKAKSQGGTMSHITKGFMEEREFILPPLSEQQAIATTLSDMDELISNLDKLIEKKKNIKKGAMQKLLTGKQRLPGFNGERKERELGDILVFHYGDGNVNPDNGGIYPIYGANGIIGGYHKFNAENSIIIGHIGTAGTVMYEKRKHFVTYNGTITTIKDNQKDDIMFMFYVLLRLDIPSICVGSSQPFLAYDKLRSLKATIPPTIEEQQAIASILSDMDKEIEALEQKKAKYENIKQGAMQKLLTGKIRLV